MLVLASSSPRRAEILTSLGVAFVIDPSHVPEEVLAGESPPAAVSRLAAMKAAEVAARHRSRWVLAADTLVSIGSNLLGKPADEAEAASMLRSIAGREHRVYTGVVLRPGNGASRDLIAESRVRIAPMSEE